YEQMVVLDADRPVRSEAILDAGTDGATPAGLIARAGEEATTGKAEDIVMGVSHGGAALDIEQGIIPGIADLAGEQAERIDPRTVAGGASGEEADIRSREISPVALSFQAEHGRAGLPAVADLTTDGA